MGLTSFAFLCFFLITGLLYYLLPKRCQWPLLLLASLFFYYNAGGFAVLAFLLYDIIVTYIGGLILSGLTKESAKKWATAAFILLTLLPLFLLKYIRFFGGSPLFGGLAPLGISFYTMSILGYVIDVARGDVTAQRNPFRHALFASYFPQMVSGPITRYREMGPQFFTYHAFSYQQVTFGLQRILWGFFKKLVISERAAIAVNTIYDQYQAYPGFYLILATTCFAFQLYTDFSGCMDIVLGASEVLGITLPENFKSPYFSRSISEYWRRWHITLGVWFKDYLFYPLLKSAPWVAFTDWSRKKFGKKRGKKPPLYIGMLILWFSVGIWHGGSWNFIVGSGILHWFYIVSGELLTPTFKKLITFLQIHTESFSWHLFQSLRTFFLVCIGFVFFRAPSLRTAFGIFRSIGSKWNPEIFFDHSLFAVLEPQEWVVFLFSLLVLLLISTLQEKWKIRETLASQNLVFRWSIYLLLFASILVFGCYGGDYNAAAFIYQNF